MSSSSSSPFIPKEAQEEEEEIIKKGASEWLFPTCACAFRVGFHPHTFLNSLSVALTHGQRDFFLFSNVVYTTHRQTTFFFFFFFYTLGCFVKKSDAPSWFAVANRSGCWPVWHPSRVKICVCVFPVFFWSFDHF
jgi:hypothetical protein